MTTDTQHENETIAVSPARLDRGRWCHEAQRQLGEGDISIAYSAQSIAMEGRAKARFCLNGSLWITAALGSRDGVPYAECYRIVPRAAFAEKSRTYAETVLEGDIARHHPAGFYHGMRVRLSGQEYVLAGPPIRAVPGAPEPVQGELFSG
ncbi:MAG: hypothetical protein HC814_07575 [Rhodobacteraceae bacterium]|nr:hypothetical protein [Paracoccaceae bacterium]